MRSSITANAFFKASLGAEFVIIYLGVMMVYLFCLLLFQSAPALAAPPSDGPAVHSEKKLTEENTAEKCRDSETARAKETDVPAAKELRAITTGTVPEASIEARVGQTIQQVLAGAVVGLSTTSTHDLASGGSTFALRLPPALGGADQPLYVLDGLPLLDGQDSSRLSHLIPADIASIEVLKGPAATAIYGTRGTFGVILMETRRGVEGKPSFSFRQSLGTTSVTRRLGARRFTRETAIATYGPRADQLWQSTFFDHEAAIFQDEETALESLFSVKGGKGRTRYFLSGSSLGKSGLIAGTDQDRDSLRLNLDHRLGEGLTLGLNMGFSKVVEPPLPNEILISGLGATPSFIDLSPDAAGNYPYNPFNSSNPYWSRDILAEQETNAQRSTASLNMVYQILDNSQSSLDLGLVLGLDDSKVTSVHNELTSYQNTAPYGDQEEHDRGESAHLRLTYRRNIGHFQLGSRLGFQYEDREEGTTITGGFRPGETIYESLASSLERAFYVEQTLTGPWYLMSAGLRSDSGFLNSASRKTLDAPWLNGALLLSERDFWRPLQPWVPEFKVRAAWGRSYVERPDQQSRLNIPRVENRPDSHREWETGLDAGFWSGRGALNLTYFNRHVDDLDVYWHSPSPPFVDNARRMEVDGFEASLSLTPLKGENWHWLARLDYYRYDALVTDLKVSAFGLGGNGSRTGGYRIQEGWSPTTIVGSNRDSAGNLIKLGDVAPDDQITWHNQVQRSAWSLNWLLDLRQGGDAIDVSRLFTDLSGTTPDLDQNPNRVQDWRNGDIRHLIHDSSYLRLREVRLAYKPNPGRFLLGDWLSSLEFALSGHNLKAWSDFPGYDPEQGSLSMGSAGSYNYPTTKSAYLSISLGFPSGR